MGGVFYDKLPERAVLQIDRAVLIVAYAKLVEGSAALPVRDICDRFERAHLARPNPTVLARRLSTDRRVSFRNGQTKALHLADALLRELIPEAIEPKIVDGPLPTKIDPRLLADAPFIDEAYLSDLHELSALYEALHVLENSMRRLIELVMARKFGPNWWDSAASVPMKRKHQDRLEKELTRRWMPARSSLGPLYSIDWADLITIMRKFENEFLPFVGDIDFLHRFADLGLLRHVIAHHGFIDDASEIQRIALALRDWNSQVAGAVRSAGL